MKESKPRQFWATAAGTEARKAEERIAQQRGLVLYELKNQAEALGAALLSMPDEQQAKKSPP
jgi:hypothetical protein